MAMSLNRVQLIGNLTRDPEARQIPGGNNVTTFGIATNFTWTDPSGQKKDKAEFHNIVAWRKLGEICSQYLRKGSKVFVEGRLQSREWQGEDGVKRSRVEIVIDNMIMLDRKGASGPSAVSGASGGSAFSAATREHRSVDSPDSGPVPSGVSSEMSANEVPIDDLPF